MIAQKEALVSTQGRGIMPRFFCLSLHFTWLAREQMQQNSIAVLSYNIMGLLRDARREAVQRSITCCCSAAGQSAHVCQSAR